MKQDGRPAQIKHYCKNPGGFTLLEVLVAISLLMAVIAIAGMAMRISLNSVMAGEKKIETLERFRSSLQIIFAQIDSEIPLEVPMSEEKRLIFRGTKDSLQLATGYSIWDGWRGYVVVGYQVVADKNGKMSLMAGENKIGFQKSMETMLFDGLENISFEFAMPREDKNSVQKWEEKWEDDKTLPQKIKLNLQYNGKKYAFIIPMRVQKSAE